LIIFSVNFYFAYRDDNKFFKLLNLNFTHFSLSTRAPTHQVGPILVGALTRGPGCRDARAARRHRRYRCAISRRSRATNLAAIASRSDRARSRSIRAHRRLLDHLTSRARRPSVATPYLELAAPSSALWLMARAALAAQAPFPRATTGLPEAKQFAGRCYSEQVLVRSARWLHYRTGARNFGVWTKAF